MRTIRVNEATTYPHAAGIHQFLASKSKSEVRALLAYYTAKEMAKELPYVSLADLISRLERRIKTQINWHSVISGCAVPFFGNIDTQGRIWLLSLDKAINWLSKRNIHNLTIPAPIRITERYSNPDLYSELSFKYACVRAVAEFVSDNATQGAKSALKDKIANKDSAHTVAGYIGGCAANTIAIRLNMATGAVNNILSKHKMSEAQNTISRETVIGIYSTGEAARASVLSANENGGFHTYNFNKRRKVNRRFEVVKKLSNNYKNTHRKIVRIITFKAKHPDNISGTPADKTFNMKVMRPISDILEQIKKPAKLLKRKVKRIALFLALSKSSASQSINYALETGTEYTKNLTDRAHTVVSECYTLKPRLCT